MKKFTVFQVIFLLTLVHGIALGSTVLYDDFSGESLDPEKWSLYSNNEDAVIRNGVLELTISGNDARLTNNLRFLQDRGIISMQAKGKIANESYVSPGARGKLRLGATFYNDSHGPRSGQSYNQKEGDVWAEIRLALDESHSLKAIADIYRADDAGDTIGTTLFHKEFTSSINFDTEYTMTMRLENGVFVFTLGSETYSYSVETPMYIPYSGGQHLTSRLYLDQGEQGLLKAFLDDVTVTYDESDNTLLVGTVTNSRWGAGSTDYNTWVNIQVYNADESFTQGVESITITTPSGEILPYTKDDFQLYASGSSFDYGIYNIPGQPEIGTYTFTIVANGKTYTATEIQYQNRALPIPDVNAFHFDGQTFSWNLVDYAENIPLYYRLRIYDANGNLLGSTGRIQDMSSFSTDGQLTMGETYRMQVRVSDSNDYYQEQNIALGSKYFTFEPIRSISGNVSGDDDNNPATPNVPVAGMHIQVFSDACNWVEIGWGDTDINGNYIVSDLPVGTDVYVKTCPECNKTGSYIGAYYGTTSVNCNEATPITITEENTPNINFNLAAGGSISGRLLDSEGNPIENIYANLFDAPCGGQFVAGAPIGDHGYFEIRGVPDIPVYFSTWSPPENSTHWVNISWDGSVTGSTDCNNAVPLHVSPLESIVNIDMTLEPAGIISGRLVDSDGNPLPNFYVNAVVAADQNPCAGSWLTGTMTDASGNFVISVPAGQQVYIHTAGTEDGSLLVDKYWDGNSGSVDCNAAVPITLVANENYQEINMALSPVSFSRNIIVLSNTMPDATVTAENSPALIYGTSQENHITLASGVDAELINFPGKNTVEVQANANVFTVYRSGATVVLEGSDGTVLKMPATSSVQTIVFNDGSLELVIEDNHVMLGNIEINTQQFSSPVAVFQIYTSSTFP